MKKPIPKMRRATIPALLCCLPLQPALAHTVGIANEFTHHQVAASRADITVSGRVVDEKGSGLPGVNVIVKGSTIGTQTDADGRFTLTAPTMARCSFPLSATPLRKYPSAAVPR
ncbi:carboxypeptidase-like regulatory domain-containing protein [Hymenobacter sp. 5516J-16]|uniref:carboxypeptidase-like regulatory domain-containing protein n=1 Tax=Hymenobacter sp. 5516J-16 TaxID=2932253 RepID=UPI001FD5E889|nr:carboxypeptidase-like regulatory domain-containing protein [Hymenobacter sp. 5516J-16]UOQ77739.1 carboxypeptidase-like regulatory domain-containing protein [Hymenobacter sp. 5516J-16]